MADKIEKLVEKEKEVELVCEDCGVIGGTTEETICPYAEDIQGIELEIVLCHDCYNSRSGCI